MTYEEALKYLQDRYEKHLFNAEENPAIAKAIEALKEMLPKKPIEKLPKEPIVNKSGRITAFKCPRCGNLIAYKVGERLRFSTLFKNNICSCGQEIEWSEEK